MSIKKNIDAKILSELGALKLQIFNSYFEDLELKKHFLGEEILYDFFSIQHYLKNIKLSLGEQYILVGTKENCF